jgi:glycine betaine catabolism A
LKRAAVDVWDGHIFINLCQRADTAPNLDSVLGPLRERFRPWRMEDLRMVHRIVYDVQANWKLIVQNYNECLHCPVLHPLLDQMHDYLAADNVPSGPGFCGGTMVLKEGVETLSADGRRRRRCLPGLGERERSLVSYFSIYPNLLLTLHPDYMVTVTIWPKAPARTELVCEWHFHRDDADAPDFVWRDAVEFWDTTNREDWRISELSQAGISSRAYEPGPYSTREQLLWDFDREVMRRLGTRPA